MNNQIDLFLISQPRRTNVKALEPIQYLKHRKCKWFMLRLNSNEIKIKS